MTIGLNHMTDYEDFLISFFQFHFFVLTFDGVVCSSHLKVEGFLEIEQLVPLLSLTLYSAI